MNYHRVMLDLMVWAIELGRISDCHLADRTLSLVTKSTQWLLQMIDVQSGRVPNYGANDGANVLPVSCCDYLDFRPTLAAACKSLKIRSGLHPGPWDEKSLWFGQSKHASEEIVALSQLAATWKAPDGGYFILRSGDSMAMLRATRYSDRPGQCDMLHLDLRIEGCNVLRDSGTFRYYHEDESVKKYFHSVAAHNTVQVDDQEQMQKGPNFLWFQWPDGNARFDGDNRIIGSAKFKCDHPYVHDRSVELHENVCKVIDSVDGATSFAMRWHLAPEPIWTHSGPGRFFGKTANGGSFAIAISGTGAENASMTDSWESLYYGQKSVIPVIVLPVASGNIQTTIEWSS
jgi:hypothetical protein